MYFYILMYHGQAYIFLLSLHVPIHSSEGIHKLAEYSQSCPWQLRYILQYSTISLYIGLDNMCETGY